MLMIIELAPDCRFDMPVLNQSDTYKLKQLFPKISFTYFHEFYPSMKNSEHVEFLEFLDKRLENKVNLSISSVPPKSKVVKNFLVTTFPNEIGTFKFKSAGKVTNKIGFYTTSLTRISQNIKKEIFLQGFEISWKNIEKILVGYRPSYKKIPKITFFSCNIPTLKSSPSPPPPKAAVSKHLK